MKKPAEKISTEQFDALHLWFRQVAQALIDSNQDMLLIIEHMKRLPINPTEENVKAIMWKPVQKALYDTKSTKQLQKHQVGEIYDHLNRLLASLPQPVHVEFPSENRLT